MPPRFNDSARRVTLGVREVLEAAPRVGDLRLALARSRDAALAAGREAHLSWQAERAAEDEEFLAEQSIRVRLVVRGWECVVRGRVDGLTEEAGQRVVEELKSTALDGVRLYASRLEDWPEYRDQVSLYRWLLYIAGRGEALGRLVMVSLLDGARRIFGVEEPFDQTRAWVEARLDQLIQRREERNAHFARRREVPVPFAWGALRPVQEDMIRAVEQTLDAGHHLLLTAPTGTGKTAGALHGALRSCWRLDRKLFVATAKGTQQAIFEQTLAAIARQGLPLRAVSVRARDRVCLNEVVDCRPEACRFAVGYHDRAPPVVRTLTEAGVCAPAALHEAAQAHTLCPFELSLDLAERADVVVGDYNYAFNPQATLRRLFNDPNEQWVVLVDEAHNLPERAREQWSPELRAEDAAAAARALEGEDPRRLAPWVRLCREAEQALRDAVLDVEGPVSAQGEAVVGLSRRVWRDLAERVDELALDYALWRRDHPVREGDPYLGFARALLQLAQVLDEADTMGVSDRLVPILRTRPSVVQKLVCLDPSPWMGRRFRALAGSVLMSATLSPASFYRDLLGLEPERTVDLTLPSPFPPENLEVVVASRVSTAWKDRAAHRARTGQLLRELIAATPGNTAVFYSSFGLLEELCPLAQAPGREALVQSPRLDDAARWALVDRLRELGPPRVLHAVMGGLFSEGLDLPGGVLSTVVIVGPALPQVGLERELMQAFYEERYAQGFSYAFLVPGLSRVVQAAGRLIRGPADRGVVVLVDRRFAWRDYTAFYPEGWAWRQAQDPAQAVAQFWGGRTGAGG